MPTPTLTPTLKSTLMPTPTPTPTLALRPRMKTLILSLVTTARQTPLLRFGMGVHAFWFSASGGVHAHRNWPCRGVHAKKNRRGPSGPA